MINLNFFAKYQCLCNLITNDTTRRKSSGQFDYDLVIYNFNFAFNKRAHILFLCIKKKKNPIAAIFERTMYRYFHSLLS